MSTLSEIEPYRSRDSGCLGDSNFAVALEMLGGESAGKAALNEEDLILRESEEIQTAIDEWAFHEACATASEECEEGDFPVRIHRFLFNSEGEFEATGECEERLKSGLFEYMEYGNGEVILTVTGEDVLDIFRDFHLSDCRFPCCSNMRFTF